ncbi:UDP-3-O-[3-hydroxymyristoyl] N-acetylglucosamine deacetylase [Aquisphaera giovannonii]|uniref:Multifunctional fusion protein n=1 Tax=Aquisphaera giovannonii TaxID=406548 RepID=A0A5B9WCG4_9BACT|nr:UDP-3-O-acyl-N-acetylglucosamine deacetylase [Aquisphaera giovannonii]QEH37964.1 UDP-3-O-[3-hydroxymyristoyl] N-acetylglucosamine deacetylase [Aquisphaera giovannonii]
MLTSKRLQRTLARTTEVRGIGFFHGGDVAVRFHPAEADSGLVFARSDLEGQPSVPARVQYVVPSQRRTTVEDGPARVEMIEHVMAALAGLRIDNCRIEIDGPECPGCDGSSRAFVEAFDQAGIVEQDAPRQALVLERSSTVREGDALLAAHPGSAEGLTLSYHLDYGADSAIVNQSYLVDLTPASFRREIAPSRTFLLEAEAHALQAAGIGRRATPADVLIFGPDGVVGNSLRYPDECARHKILDMVGDFALLGMDLHGFVVAHRSGHHTNASLVRRLLQGLEKEQELVPRPPTLPFREDGTLDIQGIASILPHRYPFLLVDRVLKVNAGRSLVAIKNVSANEPFFQGHWPGRPIMPGVLIIEAMAQAGGVLVAATVDPGARVALLASVDQVKLRRPVVPGDQLRIEVSAERIKPTSASVTAVARVDDAIAAAAKIRFVLVDAKLSA